MSEALVWSKRSKVSETPIATHRSWDSDNGLYRVTSWKSELGGQNAYPERWYAILLNGKANRILGEYKTRNRAEEECERHNLT